MRLHPLDILIIVAYLLGITFFGLRFRKSQRTLRDYFLADRNIPWWAIALSIVAAETSTLTVVSTPGLAYAGNFGFLQVALGYVVGRVFLSLTFVPQYFRGEMFTAYQLIDRRFGAALHKITAGIFLITRAAAEGVRVWAIAIVVGVALGTGEVASVAIVLVLTLIYTFEGGLAAVIWTDVVQLFIYVGGTIIGFFVLLHLVPGGWPAIHSAASAAGKLQVFDFTFSLSRAFTFWGGFIGGIFLTTATHGTDQLLVQRLLAARNRRDSQAALVASGLIVFVQFTLFLVMGVALWAFYRSYPPAAPFTKTDYIFPTFIVEHMPRAICGLLLAAILAAAMSNLSAALNSLSSTSMLDFYLRVRPTTSDEQRLRFSRIATVVWGVVLFALALASRYGGTVLEKGLSIASVAYGGLLGVFLLGLLTRRATQTGAIIGMLCGLAINVYIWGWTHIAWTWYVTIGASATFLIGYLASLSGAAQPQPEDTQASAR